MKALAMIVASALVVGACSSTGTSSKPLIPNKSIQLMANRAISLSSLATAAVVGAAIYVVYDPLAPNW